MTARATFKQSDIERACKGAIAAGLPVARVVIVDGRIEVIIGEQDDGAEDWRNGSPLYQSEA